MRCSQCGLPLSPKRNSSNCPRCGTPIITTNNQIRLEGTALPSNTFASDSQANDQTVPMYPYPNRSQSNPSVPTAAANMYTSSNPGWSDANHFQNPGPLQSSFASTQTPQVPFSSPPISYPNNNIPNQPGQSFARKPYPSTRGRSNTTRMGFTIAGLCIIAGAFLLVFVYFIGQGISSQSGTATTPDKPQSLITTVTNQTPMPTIVPTPTVPAPTATPTLPGQGLLDTSVLASTLNEQTGQIIQQSTNFQVNQKIYVVLTLHPGGNSHRACLNWYLNNQSVNTFSFDVDPASNYNYYSYINMQAAGSGRVDISLSNTADCTNATLAKKLSFTVS